MLQETQSIGEWFLPGRKNKVSGRLCFDDAAKEIILEFVSDTHLDGEPVIKSGKNKEKGYHADKFNQDFLANHAIILGLTPEKITLYHCYLAEVKKIGKNLFSVQYRIKYVFYGVHRNTLEKIQISSGSFSFPYLGCWYDSEGFLEHDNQLEAGFRFPSRFGYSDPSILDCRRDLQLIIADVDTAHLKTNNRTRLYKDKSVEFKYRRPASFGQLFQDALIFRKLLEFALGRPLRFMINKVAVRQKGKMIQIPVWNVDLHKGEDLNNLTMHQRYMLISDWNMDRSDQNQVIKKWYENEHLHPMYDYYIDTNHWFRDKGALLTNVMFNNRFLNIVQGLDAFHKRTLQKTPPPSDDKKREEFDANLKAVIDVLKKGGFADLTSWVNKTITYRKTAGRLQPKNERIIAEVIASIKDIIDPIFGQNQLLLSFPEKAATIRDPLSHGHHDKTDLGPELPLLFHLGQIILACCILKSLEVKDIDTKIRRSSPFIEYLNEILSPPKSRNRSTKDNSNNSENR
jgi:hypothetical protein